MRRAAGSSAVRWVISAVVILAAGLGFFIYRRHQASEAIRTETLAMLDDLALRPDWRETARSYVRAAHDGAFATALDVAGDHGRKFDENAYLTALFDQVIAWAREDGEDELANYLNDNRATVSLDVTER